MIRMRCRRADATTYWSSSSLVVLIILAASFSWSHIVYSFDAAQHQPQRLINHHQHVVWKRRRRNHHQPLPQRRHGLDVEHDLNSDNNNGNSWERKSFLRAVAASFLTTHVAVGPLATSTAHAATSYAGLLPDRGEIEAIVPTNDQDWMDVDNPIAEEPLSRLDSSSDTLFYQEARFVEHVDEQAVRLMTDYISSILQQQQEQPVTSVLDLCASWTSHISPTIQLKRVAGLGMNAAELQANPSLTEWAVQDLNARPSATLPYDNDSFDIILCQLSMDYLTQPLKVCRELLRVAREGGTIHILFSNRLFLTKAVALWTEKDDVDRALLLASYLHFCSSSPEKYKWDHISA